MKIKVRIQDSYTWIVPVNKKPWQTVELHIPLTKRFEGKPFEERKALSEYLDEVGR